MNWPQLKKSWMYDLLSLIVGKEKRTIIVFFYRNKLDIMNKTHVLQYVSKYYWKGDKKAKNKVKEW